MLDLLWRVYLKHCTKALPPKKKPRWFSLENKHEAELESSVAPVEGDAPVPENHVTIALLIITRATPRQLNTSKTNPFNLRYIWTRNFGPTIVMASPHMLHPALKTLEAQCMPNFRKQCLFLVLLLNLRRVCAVSRLSTLSSRSHRPVLESRLGYLLHKILQPWLQHRISWGYHILLLVVTVRHGLPLAPLWKHHLGLHPIQRLPLSRRKRCLL